MSGQGEPFVTPGGGRGMRRAERAVGAIFVLAAAVLLAANRDLPFRPAAFPGALLILLAVLGLVVMVRRPAAAGKPVDGRGLANVAAGLALIVLYVAAAGMVGFAPATGLFVAVVLALSGFLAGARWRWPAVAGVAVGVALAFGWLLVDLLRLPMP